MARDWLKIEKDTPEKPEVLAIATKLDVSVGDAFLGCFKVWRWADTNTHDGNVHSVTPAKLDESVGVPGLAKAMAEVGWLKVMVKGIRFPNYDYHMSKNAKQRALAQKRVELHRSRVGNGDGVTTAHQEKEEERDSPKENLSPLIPPSLDTPEFSAAWNEWLAYRREKRKSMTPRTIKQQLTDLAIMGPSKAVESIRQSIRNGWVGLFEPREATGQGDIFSGIKTFAARGDGGHDPQ